MLERTTHAQPAQRDIGQAIVIIAMGFVVLLAFTGIVVDVARVFVARGNLRRAVDAAGLAATGQFRQGATGEQIKQAAINLIRTHDILDPNVVVETCGDMGAAPNGTVNNDALCPPPDQPKRKLVHIKAQAPVNMLFLQLVGIPTVDVSGESTAEAASVDAVLILDTSESMAYDPPSGFAYTGDPGKGCKPSDVGAEFVFACIQECNDDTAHPCYPLQKVKDAAKAFVDRLYPLYDRIAIVDYARQASDPPPYEMGVDLDLAKQKIDQLRASDHVYPLDPPGVPCQYWNYASEKWKCGTSDPGSGIRMAINQYRTELHPRPEALWVAILLSSGGLNATDRGYVSIDPDTYDWGFCPIKGTPPNKDNPPPCRDQLFAPPGAVGHHSPPLITDTQPSLYDAEDYAVDEATYMGTAAQPDGSGGMGVLFFTIALGQKAVCTTAPLQDYDPGPPVRCANWNTAYEDQGSHLPNTGELFLRYVAAVGDDGDPTTDQCAGVPSGFNCGDYYFAPTGNDLLRIFLDIAGRIFTRLTG
jgi:hypothetical protein